MKDFNRELFTRDLISSLSHLSGLPEAQITVESDLRDDLGLDSLQSMELLSRISERWELDLEMEDVVGVRKVGDVVRYVAQVARTSEQAAPSEV